MPGQLTMTCQGNVVKRIEKHKEELKCVVISSPKRKMLKLAPCHRPGQVKQVGLWHRRVQVYGQGP